MRVLRGIAGFAIFVSFLFLALQNSDLVTLRFFQFGNWQTPLIFALLVAFACGVAGGLLVGVFNSLRQRRQIARLRRELRHATEPAPAPSDSLSIASRGDGRR